MIGYTTILNEIRTFLEDDGIAKTITHADVYERDIADKNIFPLVNIVPIGLTFDDNITTFQIDIEALCIRDLRNDIERDEFNLNSNLIDNLNECYAILRRLFDYLKRHENITVEMLSTATPIIFEGKNILDGWVQSFSFEYPETEQSVC